MRMISRLLVFMSGTFTSISKATRPALYSVCFFVFFCSVTKKSFAWVYPEHRLIALMAVQHLSPADRAAFEKLWKQASIGFENRLTSFVIDTSGDMAPKQLDFASWTAIAGDHSCSPENLLNNVLHTTWILRVAAIAAQLDKDIANAKTTSQHINAIRNADLRLQRADAEYATRASANNVHFLLSRPDVNTTLTSYLTACLAEKAPLNAQGAYAWFHMSALQKAARYASENMPEAEKSALMLAALSDEAFALHFLEDVFASGHIAGTWGKASLRKGTHDYYNEHGLEVVSWDGKRTINMGDAYMQNTDAQLAAGAVRKSLEQLVGVAAGRISIFNNGGEITAAGRPDSFNVCTNLLMPLRNYDTALLAAIVAHTPVPGLATGMGELPRFSAELGMFIGISASLNGAGLFGGFGKAQTEFGSQGGLEGNVRFGFGLDGVLNQSGDGLVFLQVGWRQDAASTNKFVNEAVSQVTNSISSAIPGRSAYNVRLRMPFWLVPGDLLMAAPVMFFTARRQLQDMAETAVNGGLIPWQSGIATRSGRFQFVLGREVGVSFYGLGNTKDVLIIPRPGADSYLLEYKSTKIDFPVIEYRTLRSFSQNQGSNLMIQLNTGVDIPSHVKVVLPAGEAAPALKHYWYAGVRVIFNWRHYY